MAVSHRWWIRRSAAASEAGSPPRPPRARKIILTTAGRRRLEKLACFHTAGYRQLIRVRIVLVAAHGYANADEGMAGPADTIKPWQYWSWLFIRAPDFAAKATRVLDLLRTGLRRQPVRRRRIRDLR